MVVLRFIILINIAIYKNPVSILIEIVSPIILFMYLLLVFCYFLVM